jgi:hypothetical protein
MRATILLIWKGYMHGFSLGALLWIAHHFAEVVVVAKRHIAKTILDRLDLCAVIPLQTAG